jgi:hypothetical protein
LNTENSLGGVAYSNRAVDINPDDIESVNVLKGAEVHHFMVFVLLPVQSLSQQRRACQAQQ